MRPSIGARDVGVAEIDLACVSAAWFCSTEALALSSVARVLVDRRLRDVLVLRPARARGCIATGR